MAKFYRCECYNEVLSIESVEEGREIEFVIYTQWGYSFRERLRHCLRILRYGKPYGDQMLLDIDAARQLANDLTEMVNVNGAEKEQISSTCTEAAKRI